MLTPDSGGRWGILGGSFDPVHNGHLNLAESISKKKELSGVLFIPSFNHPLKKQTAVASYIDRVRMLQLALENYTEFSICEIEKEETLSGYTIDTMDALKKRFPNAEFYFIIGADLVKQLHNWHRAEELLKVCKFLAGSRPGTKLESKTEPTVEFVEIEERDISASNIRQRINNSTDFNQIKKLLPAKVADYIIDKRLYQ